MTFGTVASSHPPISAFSPLDVSGLAAWWDASQESVLSNGATQTTLTDRSGNGITLTATGTPEYRTDLDLNPCIYIAPTGEWFEAASASDLDLTGNFLVIGAFYVNNAERGAGAQNTFASKDFTRYELLEYQGRLQGYVGGASNAPVGTAGGMADGGSYIVGLRRTSTSALSVRLDGAQDGSATNSASATGTYKFRIGSRPSSGLPATGLDAAVAELLIYDADVSSSDLASIESYLSSKWGVTI